MNYKVKSKTELEKLSKKELVKNNLEVQKLLEKYYNELNKYKNENTPPASNKHLKENTQGKQAKKNKKRGAPNNHKGKTREQEIDVKEIIDTGICPSCGSSDIEDNKIIKQIIDEIPDIVEPITTEAKIHEKKETQ